LLFEANMQLRDGKHQKNREERREEEEEYRHREMRDVEDTNVVGSAVEEAADQPSALAMVVVAAYLATCDVHQHLVLLFVDPLKHVEQMVQQVVQDCRWPCC